MLRDTLKNYELRTELKYSFETSNITRIIQELRTHIPDLRRHHLPRRINSIYFDTQHYSSFQSAKEGNSPRAKLRLRWYGDTFGHNINGRLELKIKSGDVGTKIVSNVYGFEIGKKTSINGVHKFLKEQELPDELSTLLYVLKPSLMVSYERNYMTSKRNDIRITIDKNLSFQRLRNFQNSVRLSVPNQNLKIIEIKCSKDNHKMRNLMTDFGRGFLRTQFSKYTYGLDTYRV